MGDWDQPPPHPPYASLPVSGSSLLCLLPVEAVILKSVNKTEWRYSIASVVVWRTQKKANLGISQKQSPGLKGGLFFPHHQQVDVEKRQSLERVPLLRPRYAFSLLNLFCPCFSSTLLTRFLKLASFMECVILLTSMFFFNNVLTVLIII